MIRVKICGLTDGQNAAAAAKAGADYVGLVFAESRRQVTVEKAKPIIASMQLSNPVPKTVGVFVNAPVEDVLETARECKLDVVQLSGDETIEYCQQIPLAVFKTIHIYENTTEDELMETLEEWYSAMKDKNFHCLLDTGIKGAYGGTGEKFNWQLAAKAAKRYKIIVAGGMTPENAQQAAQDIEPWGIDVSSGVETEGKKDSVKIFEFIRAVWNTE